MKRRQADDILSEEFFNFTREEIHKGENKLRRLERKRDRRDRKRDKLRIQAVIVRQKAGALLREVKTIAIDNYACKCHLKELNRVAAHTTDIVLRDKLLADKIARLSLKLK